MENKTDKPYSLQDAERDVWVEKGIYDIRVAAELYASKATEELRKENKKLKDWSEKQNKFIDNLGQEIERLKESNKELVEALKDTTQRMSRARVILCGKHVDDWQMLNASKYESLIQKSEGDVNKKI